ncbi:uncharacterized protein OCT59_025030 [Rhizophagus irregularis]|uniref:Bacteriophage T5 Orf172 DNA-binding domain-containing protein n=1 Tax=Rhizophagus irregularis (strain DAOM 181602 / DAOM 197198 / MUCL 43194) TaxID=747089 RepID=U9TUE8_RHIID|nr:hypothetical protein GLOIN_2v1480555 [Rhizophagus irregularis DAOM 181602=DAOM 197198]POG68718.1 hypothetical protein GLOIN_2v1480555 [Rhizophagus irregularis DAOM 181602=DAOM 197198]UZO04656.1 hypothetical protein OCT59_025030 [Rhizophagus irregularis]CAG8506098.1 22784_t:CDS:2 [Rhizophagus irregularis]|eukprot:XP_025175584.1 hypothetical protein GLOIN_2v1480555 [Rhizophagus irregularis DAOM 181602=DAOM 197198]
MVTYSRRNSPPLQAPTIEELSTKTPRISTQSHVTTPIISEKQKTLTPRTTVCKGTSVSTGRPCKRMVLDDFCHQHKVQSTGKNIFGLLTASKKNDLPKNEINSEVDIIDLSNDLTKDTREKLGEIEDKMNSLSLNSSKKGQLTQDDSKIKNSETGSTVITINLNKLKVQITEEISKKSTQVSISSESNFENREQTPPSIRSDLDRAEFTQKRILSSTKWVQTDTDVNKLPPQDRFPIESPACVDDSFLETTNKELFQTPTLITPSNELVLAPLLSISPSQSKSPLDYLFGMLNPEQKIASKSPCQSPSTPDRKPPLTPTPTKTRILSSCINTSYESRVSIKNTTPGSITPTRSRDQTDLTGDYSSTSSPSNLCQGRIKNGKICNRKIKPLEEFCHKHKRDEPEEELEKAVFVPGRARLTWLRFGDWIKHDLSADTRRLLRLEMEKPIADRDEPGFIYAYKLLEGPNSEKNSQYTLYKVGRATNVHRRLYQWAKQCGYTPELIENFPNVEILSSFSSQEFLIDREGENSVNFDNQLEFNSVAKCKYTHRAERLIHIELGARFKADIEKCEKCGNLHREWFKVKAQNLGSNNAMHGWEDVRKVIVHWVTYVEKIYGVG